MIIRTQDSGKSTDKYFVFQDGKLCVPGNKDEQIDQVARKATKTHKDGTIIKPIEIDDEEQYVEYSDSQGIIIKEKLEENMDLSTEDLAEYKNEIEDMLEKFSQELYKIDEAAFISDTEKDALYDQARDRFDKNNIELAQKYGIEFNDVKKINLDISKTTQKKIEEETEEVVQVEEQGQKVAEVNDDERDRHEEWARNYRIQKNQEKK